MLAAPLLLKTSLLSLLHRRGAVLMCIASIAMSVFVMLAVEHVRRDVRTSFTSTISGVDLLVGPRTSQLNLLLSSVFRIGHSPHAMTWQSVEAVRDHPKVRWAIPLALGDSHRGYRVVGTNVEFFQHYRYGKQQQLAFDTGNSFGSAKEVVLGANVAKALAYQLDDRLILSHGIAKHSFTEHQDYPFVVVGILKGTGTPVDNALYVTLNGIKAMHSDKQPRALRQATEREEEQSFHEGHHEHHHGATDGGKSQEIEPQVDVSAVMLGLHSKTSTFMVQRWVNNWQEEPLMAVLPGVALMELWQLMGHIEKVLFVMSVLIFVAALFGMVSMLLSSMRERKMELRVLRSLGASPLLLYGMLCCEALMILGVSSTLAIAFLCVVFLAVNTFFSSVLGIQLSIQLIQQSYLFAMMLLSVVAMSAFPAYRAYQISR